ncbi:hypothetical protein SNK04_013853 [Fusarium graminearum]
MANFAPVDMAIANPEARFPGDQEPRRMARHALRNLADNDHSHSYPYCWGFTIFRTVYTPGSDEAVTAAVDRLSRYAKHFADNESMPPRINDPYDPLPNQDLWNRYYSEVIADEKLYPTRPRTRLAGGSTNGSRPTAHQSTTPMSASITPTAGFASAYC